MLARIRTEPVFFEAESMMEGEQPASSPPADGPLEDRVQDKNWKVRKEAYEQLGMKFESEMEGNAEIFSTFGIHHHLSC